VQGVHGVRYQVKDVARSVAFYTTHLGFTLEHQQFIETLKKAGLHFRNDLETGPAASKIQIEDHDGNPIELFEPAREASPRSCAMRTIATRTTVCAASSRAA
jgi:glyoxylase I family protein